MGYKDIADSFKQELPLIKQAPWTIISSVLVLSTIVGFCEYAVFREVIAHKNDLIDTLSKQLLAKPKIVPSPTMPGSASTTGAESPANTGSGNTFTYGAPEHLQPLVKKK